MSPSPSLRRVAAVVTLSVLALGGAALGAQATPEPSPAAVAACEGIATGPTYTTIDTSRPTELEWTIDADTARIVEGGLEVAVTNGQVAFTDYTITPFPLTAVGEPSLDYTHVSGDYPALTLSYSLDGENWAGSLVYEPERLGEGTWWTTQPNNGYVRGQEFTLDEWLATAPATSVMGVGFALGSQSTGEGVVHGFTAGCTTYAFGVEVTPTPQPTSPAPTPQPTTPAPTPAPTDDPDVATVPVPTLDIKQPRCDGTQLVPNGKISIKPAPSVDWVVLNNDSLYAVSEEDVVGQAEKPGAPGALEVAPGTYYVYAFPEEGQFGDLGEWEQIPDDLVIVRAVTIAPFAGVCPAVEQLTDGTKGGFTAPVNVGAGGTVVLSGLPAGASVHAFMFSVPTDLGMATVAADGTLRLAIPATVTAGTHRIAVYSTDGALLGWQYVEVLAAPGGTQLAVTGVDPLAGVIAGLVLVGAGGALVLARRRTATR